MTTVGQTSSGSNALAEEQSYAGMDERKRKRMIANRDSARRSRMRKQKMLEDLTSEMTRLQCENSGIVGKIDETRERHMLFEAENNVLRAQAMELTERLKSTISVLERSGLKLDSPARPDSLLEPWCLPCSLQPSKTSLESLKS
ncbi:bZIP transcription factor 53-like [Diospyros lotus]|uniref:bZIP transcription factor 53-like n=1 Tax=Diospyros lotus TaxID=55363 RepID=UPI002250A7BC|nr:bZIP transcription factor 53-like [Diospyros lotus]